MSTTSAARELKSMAERGLVEITGERVHEMQSEQLISKISKIRFYRLR